MYVRYRKYNIIQANIICISSIKLLPGITYHNLDIWTIELAVYVVPLFQIIAPNNVINSGRAKQDYWME